MSKMGSFGAVSGDSFSTSVWIVESQDLVSVFIYHIYRSPSIRFAVRFSTAELATRAHLCLVFDRVSHERRRIIEKAYLVLCIPMR